MVPRNKAERPSHRAVLACVTALFGSWVGCHEPTARSASSPQTLRVGVGIGSVANPQAGIRQAVANVALEGLVDFTREGRPKASLAEKWESSVDGLSWRITIKPSARFHDGSPVTASVIREILLAEMPDYMGGAFDDVQEILAVSDNELVVNLKRRSAFLLEGLEVPIRKTGSAVIGTGPYRATGDSGGDLQANPDYYGQKPIIDTVSFRTYPSPRAAWADMLRGQVDMLYETGIEALDSLERSSAIKVFTFERPYIIAVFLNAKRKPFDRPEIRRALNYAIDREALIATALGGLGTPADGPIPPRHWAREPTGPRFTYQPALIDAGGEAVNLTCIFGDSSLERLALTVQQQLQAVGVKVAWESLPVDAFLSRLDSGQFDCALGPVINGPNLLRPYWSFHSGGPFNFGRFESRQVDAALDAIRHAGSDDDYQRGVAAFQRATMDDPPAIFLAWGQRARAVSTRFAVPAEPGRDILGTLSLWRPAADKETDSPN